MDRLSAKYIESTAQNMEERLALGAHYMYGSSRLGLNRRAVDLAYIEYLDAEFDGSGELVYASKGEEHFAELNTGRMNRELTWKQYELSNHLGNVLVTVTNRKTPIESQTTSGEIAYYEADIASAQDYYPFGATMPGRVFGSESYTYGFNAMYRDEEWKRAGNSYDFGARIYCPRMPSPRIGTYDRRRDVRRANRSGSNVKLGDPKYLGGEADKH